MPIRALLTCTVLLSTVAAAEHAMRVEQISSGPNHHFYGYIGQVRNTPWNGDGRYMVLLRSSFQDHMPGAAEAADVVLVDTAQGNRVEKLTETRAWNFQQGTMLYWHPKAVDTQFFFNDRDPETNKIFCALYDIERRERVKEFRFEDTPIANSGVLPDGEHFLALNYARLARLRPVTGYPDSFDWTGGLEDNPHNDGVWKVHVGSGEKSLLVSYAQLAAALSPTQPVVGPLFINHSLTNRDGTWMYAYARAGWHGPKPRPPRIDAPFVIGMDGQGLRIPLDYIGGHPEWAPGNLVMGGKDEQQVLYDPFTQQVVRSVGTPELIPEPGGDIALSFAGHWLVNGWHQGQESCYRFIHMDTGEHRDGPCLPIGAWKTGDLRIDPAPCWRRDGKAIAVPALAADGTRQTFVVHLE